MRILVVRSDRLGDTILTLPAVADLRAALPGATVDVCCAPPLADLVACDRHVDEVLTWRIGTPTGDVFAAIRRRGYDAAVICYSRTPLVWRLLLARIPIRVGSGRRIYAPLLTTRSWRSRSRERLHESRWNRELVRRLLAEVGADTSVCDASPRTGLVPDEASERRASDVWNRLRLGGKVVVLQPGSQGSSLDWPPKRMEELARELRARERQILVHLGPGDRALAPLFHRHATIGEDLSLPELAAVLKRAAVLVGNSTGPLHLAGALGTPVVGLYPPVRELLPERWGPLGEGHRLIVGGDGERVHLHRDAAPAECMYAIPVERVAEEVEELLDG